MTLATQFKDNCDFGLRTCVHDYSSQQRLQDADCALNRMMHRDAVDADGKSRIVGGLPCSVTFRFMHKLAKEQGPPFSQWSPVCIPADAPPTIKDRP